MTEPLHDSGQARAPGARTMRHRVGAMICPRCERQLQACDHAQGIAWRCEKCGGQSLNFSQFRRMVPPDGANVIWENAMARPNAPKQRTRCPECHNGMDAVHIPLRDKWIELDICRPCQRLWLDRQADDDDAAKVSFALTSIDAPARRRSWFAPRSAAQGATGNSQRNPLSDRFFERGEHGGFRRQDPGSLFVRAIIAGIGVYLLSWPLPVGIRIRLAAVAAVIYLVLRIVRR